MPEFGNPFSRLREAAIKAAPSSKSREKEERKESIATHEIHMELMDHLKQISVYVTEIAKSVVNVND